MYFKATHQQIEIAMDDFCVLAIVGADARVSRLHISRSKVPWATSVYWQPPFFADTAQHII